MIETDARALARNSAPDQERAEPSLADQGFTTRHEALWCHIDGAGHVPSNQPRPRVGNGPLLIVLHCTVVHPPCRSFR